MLNQSKNKIKKRDWHIDMDGRKMLAYIIDTHSNQVMDIYLCNL